MRVVLLAVIGGAVLASLASAAEPSSKTSFRSTIAPLLRDRCLACHNAKQAEGGYRIDTYSELLKPGDSGEPPIAGSTDEVSELIRRIVTDDEFERMPAESDPLAPEQVASVKKWVAEGATFDGQDSNAPLALVIPPAEHPKAPAEYAAAVPITGLVFSPDGQQLVTGGYHEILVWDVGTQRLVRRIGNVDQRVFAMAFAADGKTLAVGGGQPGRSGEVRLIDFETGQVKGVIARADDVVLDLAFRPDTNEVAVAMADSSIRLVDVETRVEVKTLASHADWVTAVAWSADGNYLASASRDKTAKVYDGNSGRIISSYPGHADAVRGIVFSTDSLQVFSVGDDAKIHRWAIDKAKKITEIPIGGRGFQVLRVQEELLVPCSDHRLLQIDERTNKIVRELKEHRDWVLRVAVPPNAAEHSSPLVTASGSFDGEVRLWDPSEVVATRQWIAAPNFAGDHAARAED